MNRFSEIHGEDLVLDANSTTASRTTDSGHHITLFSNDILHIGDKFTIRIKDDGGASRLYLGVTEQSPAEWREGGERQPWNMRRTRLLETDTGCTWINGDRAGCSRKWFDRFPHHFSVQTGDIVSVSLCNDKSVSVIHNECKYTRVFTNLPDQPLHVVMFSAVNSVQIVHSDYASLQDICRQVIKKKIKRKWIDDLPLSPRIKEFIFLENDHK